MAKNLVLDQVQIKQKIKYFVLEYSLISKRLVIIAYLNTLGWFGLSPDCSDQVWFKIKLWFKQ